MVQLRAPLDRLRSGALRDNCVKILRGFVAKYGMCTTYKLELLATEMGLEMAISMGVQKIILQINNQACLERPQKSILSW